MNETSKSRSGLLQKALAAICILCLLLSFGTAAVSAQSATKLTVSSCTADRGDNASVSFSLEGNPGIWGIKLRIHYDHSALALKSVTTGSVFESSEFMMSESLSKEPYVVMANGNSLVNKTANGKIVTLNFTVSSNAKYSSYPVTVEITQAINVDGSKISISAVDGSVSVVQPTTAAPTTAKPTTAPTTAKPTAAPTTAKPTAVPTTAKPTAAPTTAKPTAAPTTAKPTAAPTTAKPTAAPTTAAPTTDAPTSGSAPEIIDGADLIFTKDSEEPLVFASNADFSEFIRAEVDGKALDASNYTVKSGSTIVTVNAEYLNSLSSGNHTIAIVSESGTATAQFTVKNETEAATAVSTAKPTDSDPVETGMGTPVMPIILAIVIVLLTGASTLFIVKKRRSL